MLKVELNTTVGDLNKMELNTIVGDLNKMQKFYTIAVSIVKT
jgi:hypothetical protein